MNIELFETKLRSALARHLPKAQIMLERQRSVLIQGRIVINDGLFLSVYFNALTSKTSYALIHNGQRVMGYDNYRFWHFHPFGSPDQHLPCEEPSVDTAIAAVASAVNAIQTLK